GRWLAVLAGPRHAAVFDLEHPGPPVHCGEHPGVWFVTISPDGRWLATGVQHGSGVKVWDARTGKLAKDIAANRSSVGLFSHDGRWLVTGSAGQDPQTWDVLTWQRVAYNKQHGGGSFSPDGKLIVFPRATGRYELVDAASGRQLAVLTAPTPLDQE